MIDDPRLPPIPGGWKLQSIDVGWTRIELAIPANPDALLGDEQVLEANRRDDYMPYWASLWPAATRMATLLDRAAWRKGASVLELGCGLGLVGIAGALRGWNVLLTDYELQATTAAALNAERNGVTDIRTAVLDWRHPPKARYEAILACDVLYEVRNHRPLLTLLQRMLTPDGCCWLGDPGRTPINEFHHAATDAGFAVRILSEQGTAQSFPARGQFQLLELRPHGARH